MKKWLAVLLVFLLVLALVPASVSAAGTIYRVWNSAQLADALAAASDGDTICLYDGTYALDQTTLNMDLTIIGESEDGVILTPTGNTGAYSTTGGDTSGWIFLESGSLSISNLTMDGTGFAITQALRTKGALTVENVTVKNIEYSQYFGFGIGVYQPGSLDAKNVTMSNIARVGIHAKGDTAVDGFNYTGKGAITCLDYAMEIGTFNGSMTPFTVDVANAVITDCLGVADDSAKSGSAALYVNTYFYQADGGTTSLIDVNLDRITINNCSVGVYIGYYEKGEYSDTLLTNSNIINCETDIAYQGLAGTSTFTTSGNYFGGGAPNVECKYGNTIAGIEDYVTNPVAMSQDTDVTAVVDPTYMIIIPAAVDFGILTKGTGVQEMDFPVEARDVVIENGYEIVVGVSSPFVMNDQNGAGPASLGYKLYDSVPGLINDGDVFSSFEADRTETGEVTVNADDIVKAGSYKGTMDFAISYEAK